MCGAMGTPDMPLFEGGRATLAQTACHTVWSPQVPYVLNAQKAGRVPKYCITECDSAHVGPLKVMEVMGIQFIGPCLKAMGILLILVTQTSG